MDFAMTARAGDDDQSAIRTIGISIGYAELVGGGDLAAAVKALERAIQLEPRREESRILLAQALARQGEYEKATALLGPLIASGRTADMRALRVEC